MKEPAKKIVPQTTAPDATTGPSEIAGAGTVTRVVKMLASIAEADGEISIKSLCQSLNLPASTVHRLLGLLTKEGMIERAPSRALYGPGLEFLRIGSLVAAKIRIVDLARPILRALVEECDESCVLLRYIPASRKVMALHAEYSSHPLRYQIEMFQPHSLLWGATGRSVLAFLPEREIDAAIKDDDPSPASGEPLPPRSTLLKELREIRTRGYAITQGQKITGAVGLAAPLFNSERRAIGSLSITVPKARYNQKGAAKLSALLLASAASLNRSLGFQS
ncbi:MAG: IclR family transcriptional regulator [Pseudorhodoplanes sp.]